MRKVKIINLLLLLIIIAGSNSCIYDDYSGCYIEEPVSEPKWPEDIYLNLNLGVLSPTGSSKTRAEIIDDNNYFENPISQYEKMRTIRVIIVRGTRTTPIENVVDSTGFIEHNHLFTLDNLGVIEYDDMTFKVKSGEKKNIYFIVNEAFIKERTLIDFDALKVGSTYPTDILEEMTLSRENNKPLINNENPDRRYYLPMSEKFEIDIPVPQNPEDYQLYKNFFVTRASVKFSFNVSFATTEFPNSELYVKDLKIYSFANKEYVLPKNTKYSEPVFDATHFLEGRFVESYSTPENIVESSFTYEKDFPYSEEVSTYSPAIYFPESKANTKYSVGITLCDRTNTDSIIVLDPIELDNLPSLPRNTHVLVNLTVGPHSLAAEAVVFPYTAVTLNPEFGFGSQVSEGSLSQTSLELEEGDVVTLTATFNLDDTENKNLIWVTSDVSVLTIEPASGSVVNMTGGSIELAAKDAVKLTAQKEGKAVITVYSQNGLTAKCEVTVNPKKAN